MVITVYTHPDDRQVPTFKIAKATAADILRNKQTYTSAKYKFMFQSPDTRCLWGRISASPLKIATQAFEFRLTYNLGKAQRTMARRILPLARNEYRSLEILRPLQDIITPSGSNAVFFCEVIGYPSARATWYKDGIVILSSPRVRISAHLNNFRLEINQVIEEDHGLYSVMFANNKNRLISKGRLFLSPNEPNEAAMYVLPPPRRMLQIMRPVHPIVIRSGLELHMEPVFRARSVHFSWYRNNELQRNDGTSLILSTTLSSSFSIHHCNFTDSGVYLLLNRTQFGILSLIVDVLVVDSIPQNVVIPAIDASLPEDLNFHMGDEVNLILRVCADGDTIIDWYKRGRLIEYDEGVNEFYGEGYIGLRIPNATEDNVDEYSVIMTKIVGKEVTSAASNCCLTLNSKEVPKNLPTAKLKMPLMSVLACVGSKVIFHCTFSLAQFKYFYVVWKIGRHCVECSNSKFQVASKGGEFILYIPTVCTSMVGTVICELRVAIPHRKSAFVAYSHAHLAILPPKVLKQMFKQDTMYHKPKIYKAGMTRLQTKQNEAAEDMVTSCSSESSVSLDDSESQSFFRKNLFHPIEYSILIVYCRFSDGYYYLLATVNDDTITDAVRVQERAVFDQGDTFDTFVSWNYVMYPVHGVFLIELYDSTDTYCEVGSTSAPRFEIKAVPVGTLLKIRVRSVGSLRGAADNLSIRIDLDEAMPLLKRYSFGTIQEFDTTYTTTSAVVGTGAFGCVNLVESGGKSFAAKVIKTRLRRKREAAIREFDVMRKLCHSRVCDLVEAFQGPNYVVLVMEYLWGGELFERILESGEVKEVDVIPYVRQICEGLRYMHSEQVIHLDLKPENVVCVRPNSNEIKIIDFGLARVLVDGVSTKVIYGTRDYIAPEVLNYEDLTTACDMWSLGVITYVLLTGVVPFAGEEWPERLNNILLGRYNYQGIAVWETSNTARLFVDELLSLDPRSRLTADEALAHQWVVEGPPPEEQATDMKISQKRLKSYVEHSKAGRRWQRIGNVMIAAHRLRSGASNQPGPSSRLP